MPRQNIWQAIQSEIARECALEFKKLEKETDEVRRQRLMFKGKLKILKLLLQKFKTMSKREWDEFAEQFAKSTLEHGIELSGEFDKIVFKKSTNPNDYATYEKMKRMTARAHSDFAVALDDTNLNKKQLERLLFVTFVGIMDNKVLAIQNDLAFFELGEAVGMVERRFDFKAEWLVCLALIQLYENMIKKKLTELKGKVQKEDKLEELTSRLAVLIREKEGRNISLSLLMSSGIKAVRNVMTHEGYKHEVSKQDLRNLHEEIADFERILYPKVDPDKPRQ